MARFFQMNTASTSGSGPLPSNTIANPKGELKAITTKSGLVLDRPSVPMPPPFINPEEDERVEETLTDSKLVRNFTFLVDFVIVDYKSDPRVPLILGRPFLQTARALIDVHREEMILYDGDERLTLNMRHDTSRYSNQLRKESINMINIFNDSCEDYLEGLFATNHLSGNPTFSSHTYLTSPEDKDDIFDPEGDIFLIKKLLNRDSTKDLPPPHNINPLSGKEFIDELTLITFPLGYDDLPFDIESDLREIEYFLNHDPTKEMDSILKDSVDEGNLANHNVNLVDTIPEMFTNEHALDYSSPQLYDEYDNDLFELESDNDDIYNDPFDSKGEKIKESKLLIDELDLPRLITIQATPDKNVNKISIYHASLILEDFDPPLYELPFHKEVPRSETLLSFSSENEEKVFKSGFLTSKGVHSSLLPELSHRGPKVFKVIKILESPMEIFPCSYGENIRILDVPCLHFYPP
nr:reverse transcriptase domain-containing protein [Tanacetum cinerariifolium]